MLNVTEIESYKDYGKCIKLSNGKIEATVTVEIGPRIIGFGFCGSQNFMNDDRAGLGGKPVTESYKKLFGEGRKWESLGGHRIWITPEAFPDTYTPDDMPCTYTVTENGIILKYAPDTEIGVAKTMELKLDGNGMEVKMDVKNIGLAPKEFSVWSISVCAKNGTLIIPMNTNDTDLLHNRTISVWPYTDMSNERIYWGNKYVTVKQIDTADDFKMKLGFDCNKGIAHYVLGNEVFTKKYTPNHPDGKYADGGCSLETYTCPEMLEFETLGEIKNVAPGEENTHTEYWSLTKTDCDVDFRNDDSIDAFIKAL